MWGGANRSINNEKRNQLDGKLGRKCYKMVQNSYQITIDVGLGDKVYKF